jgi:hypothetical protein
MKSVSNRDTNLGIIVEAKQQYTKQLMNIMKPIIYEELFDIYTRSVEDCENQNDLLICFQNELKQVPKWNSDVIKAATSKIMDSCSYFNDLITAVFLSNVRILTSVKLGSNKKRKVKLVVPTNETFVHKVYVNVSKAIYNDPFTFSNKRYSGNVLRNMNDVFPLIETSIEDTIRDMLPIQSILESYLGDTMNESESESESESPDGEEDLNEVDPSSEEYLDNKSQAGEEDYSPVNESPADEEAYPPVNESLAAESPVTENDFFAKPKEEIKDITLGRPNLEPTLERTVEQTNPITDKEPVKRPQTFFDDVDD